MSNVSVNYTEDNEVSSSTATKSTCGNHEVSLNSVPLNVGGYSDESKSDLGIDKLHVFDHLTSLQSGDLSLVNEPHINDYVAPKRRRCLSSISLQSGGGLQTSRSGDITPYTDSSNAEADQPVFLSHGSTYPEAKPYHASCPSHLFRSKSPSVHSTHNTLTPRVQSYRYINQNNSYPATMGDLQRQCLRENEPRGILEREIASMREDLDECTRQNDTLRQEIRCLQSDNAVLVSQLDEQTACLAAVTFDSERYKSELETHGINVPESLFYEVSRKSLIPRLSTQSGTLPSELIEFAQISEEEKANFTTIHSLVNTINELQVRLRETHLRRATVSDERVIGLQELVSTVESQLTDAKTARETMRQRFEDELSGVIKKKDTALGRLAILEAENSELTQKLQVAENKESLQIEQLKLQELEEKIESLQDVIDTQAVELHTLRADNTSLASGAIILKKEQEYFAGALSRERTQSDGLRKERDTLCDELNALKTSLAQTSTNLLLLQGKSDLSERLIRSKDTELLEWKRRVAELQQKIVDEHAQLDRSLQEVLGKLSRTEIQLATSQQRVETLEKELEDRDTKTAILKEHYENEKNDLLDKIHASEQSVDEACSARSAANVRITQLQLALKTEKEERQVLADRVELIERQAQILKTKYPSLEFEIVEEEIQRFEIERLSLITEANQSKASLLESERRIESLTLQIEELKDTVISHESRNNQLQEAISNTEKKCDNTKQLLEQKETELKNAASQIQATEKSLKEYQDAARTKDQLYETARTELDQLKLTFTSEIHLLSIQIDELQKRNAADALDAESIRQGHRLEIQAHSRDLQRLDLLQKEFENFRLAHENEFTQTETKMIEIKTQLIDKESQLVSEQRKLSTLESERQAILLDNDAIRQLLQEKLDTLEMSDSTAQQKLAERLRVEETLRRELNKSRVEMERLKLDLTNNEKAMLKFQSQTYSDSALIEQLRNDIKMAQSNQSSVEITQQQHDFIILKSRYDRLLKDFQHQSELRRGFETQLNNLLAETEPIRRREALIQGELVSLKNMLMYSEKDADLYKSKYFALTKGYESAIETQKNDFLSQINSLNETKSELELKLSDTSQQLTDAIIQRDVSKTETDKLSQETTTMKNQIQTLQSEIQALQTTIQTLQRQRPPRADNSEIQKRYQVQLSNLQRLVQQVNGEKDKLKNELNTSQTNLQTKQVQLTSLEHKCSEFEKEIQQLKLLIEQKTKSHHSLTETESIEKSSVLTKDILFAVNNVVDEAVRVGLLSSLLTQKKINPLTTSSSQSSLHHPLQLNHTNQNNDTHSLNFTTSSVNHPLDIIHPLKQHETIIPLNTHLLSDTKLCYLPSSSSHLIKTADNQSSPLAPLSVMGIPSTESSMSTPIGCNSMIIDSKILSTDSVPTSTTTHDVTHSSMCEDINVSCIETPSTNLIHGEMNPLSIHSHNHSMNPISSISNDIIAHDSSSTIQTHHVLPLAESLVSHSIKLPSTNESVSVDTDMIPFKETTTDSVITVSSHVLLEKPCLSNDTLPISFPNNSSTDSTLASLTYKQPPPASPVNELQDVSNDIDLSTHSITSHIIESSSIQNQDILPCNNLLNDHDSSSTVLLDQLNSSSHILTPSLQVPPETMQSIDTSQSIMNTDHHLLNDINLQPVSTTILSDSNKLQSLTHHSQQHRIDNALSLSAETTSVDLPIPQQIIVSHTDNIVLSSSSNQTQQPPTDDTIGCSNSVIPSQSLQRDNNELVDPMIENHTHTHVNEHDTIHISTYSMKESSLNQFTHINQIDDISETFPTTFQSLAITQSDNPTTDVLALLQSDSIITTPLTVTPESLSSQLQEDPIHLSSIPSSSFIQESIISIDNPSL